MSAGESVVVTGGASGIGLACAKALQAAGAHVHVSARDLGTLSEWAAACKAEGLPVELMSLDVTDALQVKYVARQVAAGGPLDFVLYCAGHYRAQRATEFDLNDMHINPTFNNYLFFDKEKNHVLIELPTETTHVTYELILLAPIENFDMSLNCTYI